MRITSAELAGMPALQAAVEKALAKEKAGQPAESKVTWIARMPLLKVKPIKSKDPIAFMKTIKQLQEMYPKMAIFIFEIEAP